MEERASRKTRTGIVTSDKMDKTITVAVVNRKSHPIYGKTMTTTVKAANRPCRMGLAHPPSDGPFTAMKSRSTGLLKLLSLPVVRACISGGTWRLQSLPRPEDWRPWRCTKVDGQS